ncbi:MAG: response regulator [Candidatus Omnitrophica bacterium]|nr:response regulator [Candidatus Omnitrophota bacterium]
MMYDTGFCAKKILIVDDDSEILEMTKIRLGSHGYKVLIAKDGVDGLRQVQKEKPDLILLDIVMPKMDGFEVLRRLQADSATRRIPVIMLSAKGETKTLMEGEHYGATDYFIKPCDWQELLKYLKKYLD